MSGARYTATRTSLRTAGVMLLFTIVFTALMSGTYSLTRPTIDASRQAGKMRLINELLPADRFDNDLLADYVDIGPTPELGLDNGGRVYRARKAGVPAALVFDAVAKDGYAGRIAMAVASGRERPTHRRPRHRTQGNARARRLHRSTPGPQQDQPVDFAVQ